VRNLPSSNDCSLQARDSLDRIYTLTFSIYDNQPSAATLNLLGSNCLHTGYLFWYSAEDLERHCVYLRGYDASSDLLIGHNSWGSFRKLVYIESNSIKRKIHFVKVDLLSIDTEGERIYDMRKMSVLPFQVSSR